jgi:hypothetical protein
LPIVPPVRGARQRVVLAVVTLAMVGSWAVPARAQLGPPPTQTTTTTTEEPTTTTAFTLVPTTSTTVDEPTTTSTVRRTTTTSTSTTLQSGPVVTLAPTTTTTELQEGGPAPLPTTTSLPTPENVDRGLSAGTIVSLVIAALLLIAAVLAIFTWRFWQSTRPAPPTVADHG